MLHGEDAVVHGQVFLVESREIAGRRVHLARSVSLESQPRRGRGAVEVHWTYFYHRYQSLLASKTSARVLNCGWDNPITALE